MIQRERGYFDFTYKEADESMGPVEDRRPRRLLERLEALVPEPPNGWATERRARCWENVH